MSEMMERLGDNYRSQRKMGIATTVLLPMILLSFPIISMIRMTKNCNFRAFQKNEPCAHTDLPKEDEEQWFRSNSQLQSLDAPSLCRVLELWKEASRGSGKL